MMNKEMQNKLNKFLYDRIPNKLSEDIWEAYLEPLAFIEKARYEPLCLVVSSAIYNRYRYFELTPRLIATQLYHCRNDFHNIASRQMIKAMEHIEKFCYVSSHFTDDLAYTISQMANLCSICLNFGTKQDSIKMFTEEPSTSIFKKCRKVHLKFEKRPNISRLIDFVFLVLFC